jgi:hypothetical protein
MWRIGDALRICVATLCWILWAVVAIFSGLAVYATGLAYILISS